MPYPRSLDPYPNEPITNLVHSQSLLPRPCLATTLPILRTSAPCLTRSSQSWLRPWCHRQHHSWSCRHPQRHQIWSWPQCLLGLPHTTMVLPSANTYCAAAKPTSTCRNASQKGGLTDNIAGRDCCNVCHGCLGGGCMCRGVGHVLSSTWGYQGRRLWPPPDSSRTSCLTARGVMLWHKAHEEGSAMRGWAVVWKLISLILGSCIS